VTLHPTHGVELRVLVAPGLSMPSWVRVLISDASGNPLFSDQPTLGENGSFRLTSLPNGNFRALVGAPGLAALPVEIHIPGPPVVVTLFPAARVELSLPALAVEGTRVTLAILDSTGRPLLAPMPQQIPPGGTVTLPDFPPGTWTVVATAADGRSWTGSVSTSPGVTSRLVLE